VSEESHEFVGKIELRFSIVAHGCSRQEGLIDANDEFERVLAKIKALDFITVKYQEPPRELVRLRKS